MYRTAVIGALAPLFLLAMPARADWRTPISGAPPILPSVFLPAARPHATPPSTLLAMPGARAILPSRFTPMIYEVVRPSEPAVDAASPAPETDVMPPLTPAAQWSLPLVDRRLSAAQREAEIAPELQEAITRIEPMYDPTRLNGPDAEVVMVVSAGTAAMDNVFADHWRRASPDANVNARTAYLAMAWQRPADQACDVFAKNRPHQVGEVALTALSAEDCARLRRYQALAYDEVAPTPVVVAPVSVPVFAAPLPGSRMSSGSFWEAQKARIRAIEASLHHKWDARPPVEAINLRP